MKATDRAVDQDDSPALGVARSTVLRDRLLVTLAALVCVIGTLLGTGLLGGSVAAQGDGLFSDDATLIAPHGPAFSIWSVIYLGLAGYVGWQWLPASTTSLLAAATRLPAAASLLLNGLWLIVVQADLVWISVVVIALLLVSLIVTYRRVRLVAAASASAPLVRAPARAPVRALVEGTFGLYLGWVCVAICANIALALVGSGVPSTGTGPGVATVLVLAVVVGVATGLMLSPAPPVARAAAATAIVWGLSWIAVGRFVGEPPSTLVAWAAVVAAVFVVGAWFVSLRRVPPIRTS